MFTNHEHQQTIADQLLRIIEIPTAVPKDDQTRAYEPLKDKRSKRSAIDLLQAFERETWQPRAFENAFKAHPEFALVEGVIKYVGDGDWREAVCSLLTDYDKEIPKAPQPAERRDPDDIPTMTTEQAAIYLGVNENTIYLHATRKHTLHGELIGNKVLMFSKNELDRYKPLLGRRGRPVKNPQNGGTS